MKRASFAAALILSLSALVYWLAPRAIVPVGIVVSVLCVAFFVLFLRRRSLLARDLLFYAVCALLSALILYFPVTDFHQTRLDYMERTVSMTVELTKDPTMNGDGTFRYVARPTDGSFSDKFCFFSSAHFGRAGTQLHAQFSFFLPDRDSYLTNLSQGIVLKGVLCTPISEVEVTPASRGFAYAVSVTREYVHKTLVRHVGVREGGFMTSVLTGEKSHLTPDEYQALSETGMLHIVAVSGLHVAIFMSFALFFLEKVHKYRLQFVLSLLALVSIFFFSGFSASVCRAVVMTAIALFGETFFRVSCPFNRLGIAAIVVLLIQPHAILSPSFHLSFFATAGIILFSRPLGKYFVQRLFVRHSVICGGVLHNLVYLFAVSASSFIFVLPLSMFFFDQLTVLSLLLSPLLIPILEACFALSLMVLILSPIPILGTVCPLLGILIEFGVRFMVFLTSAFADLIGAVQGVSPLVIGIIVAVLLIASVFLFFLPAFRDKTKRGTKKKIRNGVLLAGLAVLLLVAYQAANRAGVAVGRVAPGDGVLQTAFLSVGQGNCAVSVMDGEACVVDCGGTEEPGLVAAEYLTDLGIDTVEFVLISHLHSDHMNGLSDLCEEKQILEIIIPYTEGDAGAYARIVALAAEEEATLTVLREDTTRTLGSSTLRLLTKHLDPESDDQNENSIVALAECGDYRALFTGDITEDAERRLINAYGAGLRCDVLSVPHHGSKSSSCEEFLKITKPMYAVVSVGAQNSYGHPTEAAMMRIAAVNAKLFRTDTMSTVTVRTDGTSIEVEATHEP